MFQCKNSHIQKSAERVDLFTDTARFVYGDAIYGGFSASITYVIIGGLLLEKRFNQTIEKIYSFELLVYCRKTTFEWYFKTQYKTCIASYFTNSSKRVPGTDPWTAKNNRLTYEFPKLTSRILKRFDSRLFRL